jgi:NADPH:quinone reductase-like Zn-dependent oxidoreductase
MINGWKTHAEHLTIDEDYIALKPDKISHVQAASIPIGALNTLIALQDSISSKRVWNC